MVVCLRREAVVAWGFVLPETVDGLPDFVDGKGRFSSCLLWAWLKTGGGRSILAWVSASSVS